MTTTEQPNRMRFEEDLLPVLISRAAERQTLGNGPRRGRLSGVRWPTVVTVVAAVVAIAIVLPLVPWGHRGADEAAAAMLRKVSRRAAAQPAAPGPGPGQFLYTKQESFQTFMYVVGNGEPNFFFEQPQTRESWIAPDGSGRILEVPGPVTFPTATDRAAWVSAGSPDLADTLGGEDRFGPGELPFQDFSDLPTNPTKLLDVIEQREIVGGPDGDWETFRIVGDLLRETYTTPAVRAALYEVAAELPGVELVGGVTDQAGRPGVAVAYTYDVSRIEWIFDPKTAELLGEREVLLEDSTLDTSNNAPGDIYGGAGPAGTITYDSTFLVRGVTNSVTERPQKVG